MATRTHLPSLRAAMAALGSTPDVAAGIFAEPDASPALTAVPSSKSGQLAFSVSPRRHSERAVAVKRRRPVLFTPIDDGPLPEALSAALSLATRPSLADAARSQPLPHGITWLIRIAGGSTETLHRAVHLTGKDPHFIYAAVTFYLETVLWGEGSDGCRVLGVAPGASRDKVAEHTRWLMKLLVSDLGRNEAGSRHAERVFSAWLAFEAGEAPATQLNKPSAALVDVLQAGSRAAVAALAGLPRWPLAALATIIFVLAFVSISGAPVAPPASGASSASSYRAASSISAAATTEVGQYGLTHQ